MKYNNHNVIIYLIIFVIMNGVKAQGMKKKILCLHGGGSSGPAFQSQTGMKNLMASLDSNKYEFVFANTPENNGVWIKDPPGGKEGIATNSSDDKESEKDTGGVCSTKKDKATCNAESGCTWATRRWPLPPRNPPPSCPVAAVFNCLKMMGRRALPDHWSRARTSSPPRTAQDRKEDDVV